MNLLNDVLKNVLKNIPDDTCFNADILKDGKFSRPFGETDFWLHLPFTISMVVSKKELEKNNTDQITKLVRARLINNLNGIIDTCQTIKKGLKNEQG